MPWRSGLGSEEEVGTAQRECHIVESPTLARPVAPGGDIWESEGSTAAGVFLDCIALGWSLVDSRFDILFITDFLHLF